MSKREPIVYLQDILDSLEKIEQYIQNSSFEQFQHDEKTLDAVVRNLEIIGEAARNIPSEFRNKYPQIPWEKMVSIRNKVLHEYFGLDEDILWKTVREDLPALKTQIQEVSSQQAIHNTLLETSGVSPKEASFFQNPLSLRVKWNT